MKKVESKYIERLLNAIHLMIELERIGIINETERLYYGNRLAESETDTKQQANIIIELLEKATKNKLYNEVVSFSESVEENNLQVYDLMTTDYFIFVGASYQELGNLNMANKYFDFYIECIEYKRQTDLEYEKQIIKSFKDPKLINGKGLLSLMFVIGELRELGLEYKLPADTNNNLGETLKYNFGYLDGDKSLFVDGEQKYHLKGDENIPIKEYLEEYIKPLNYDKETYELIIGPYSKDKNNVYFLKDIIEGADAKSFRILSLLQLLSRDDNNLFYVNIKKQDIDINTFELKGGYFALDKNYIYNYYLNEIVGVNNKDYKFGSCHMDNAYFYYDRSKNIYIKTYKGKTYFLPSGKKYESMFEEGKYYYPNINTFIRHKT